MTHPNRQPSANTRAIAYVRVSTDKQADEGVSLDAQRAKCAAWAVAQGLVLVETIEDAGVSAKTLERPGLARALGMLRRGEANALLVTKLDRLTRRVRDLSDLVETHFASGRSSLLSVGESIDTRTAAGRMVLNLLATVGQWEREAIGERTREALAHKRSRGEYTGGHAPFGWRPDGDGLAEDAAEQATLAVARELRSAGLSLRAVAAELAARGVVGRTGRPLSHVQVDRMLRPSAEACAAE